MSKFANLAIAAVLFIGSILFGGGDILLAPGVPVILRGKVIQNTYLDADGQPEEQFVLVLQKKIDVSQDKFGGPTKGVARVQIIPLDNGKSSKELIFLAKASKSKCSILAHGKLVYPVSAHHHTKVCIEIDSLFRR